MDSDALHEQLTKLHDELRRAGSKDSGSNELLSQFREDIERLKEPGGEPSGESSLPERLERIAVQFEVDHPTLAASSRRLVDLLGKVGL